MSIVQRLVTAKQFVADGDAARRRRDESSRRQAVIAYDVAVEDALLAVAAHLGRPRPRKANRKKMVELLKDKLPSHADALRLRTDIRNDAMHEGSAPTEAEAEEASRCAINVLRDAFTALGHSFDAFSLVGLVENPLVRTPLEGAQTRLDDPPAALAIVLQAWRRLEGVVQEAIATATGVEMWFFRSALWEDRLLMSNCADHAHEHALHHLQVLTAQTITADQSSILRLRQLGAKITIERAEDHFLVEVREGEDLGRSDVEWALDFVSTVAYHLERANPNLRQAVMAPRRDAHAPRLPGVVRDRATQH